MTEFLGGVGVTAAVVAAFFAWRQYRLHTTALVVQAEAHPFMIPTSVSASYRNLVKKLQYSLPALDDEAVSLSERQAWREWARAAVSEAEPLQDFIDYPPGRFWSVTLSNNGNDTAKAVGITLPGARLAAVAGPGGQSRVERVDELVEIGDVRPGDTISVSGWAYGFGSLAGLKVVQARGRATISRHEHVGPFWVWLSRNIWPLLWVAFFIGLFITSII